MTDTKMNNLKPLDEYLNDINSRNTKYGEYIPSLKDTVRDVYSYDELYKKLIDESYYICNELVNKRSLNNQHTRNHEGNLNNKNNTIYETDEGVNRELIFRSTDNLESSNRHEAELLSPIIKTGNDDVSKSYFYSTTNKFGNTEMKKFLGGVGETKGRERIPLTDKKNYLNKSQNQPRIPEIDLLCLINNTKEIEKMLERDDPIQRIELFEDRIMRNLKKLEQMEEDELQIVESKHEMEQKSKEIESLFRQFAGKFEKVEEYLDLIRNSNPVRENPTNLNNSNISKNKPNKYNSSYQSNPDKTFSNSSFHYKPNFQSERERAKEMNEVTNYILTTENEENTNDRSRISNKGRDAYNYGSNNNENSRNRHMSFNNNNDKAYNSNNSQANKNYIKTDSDHYDSPNESSERIPREISNKINSLLSNSNLKEASDLWKKYNYEKFDGVSFDRSYEMLAYLSKLKDREIDLLTRKLSNLEDKVLEMRRKDAEIVELFAELELYKNKVKVLEFNIVERHKTEQKMNSLIKENSLLYKENVKLKALSQQEKYLSSDDRRMGSFINKFY